MDAKIIILNYRRR